jgi:hypothetical protein
VRGDGLNAAGDVAEVAGLRPAGHVRTGASEDRWMVSHSCDE